MKRNRVIGSKRIKDSLTNVTQWINSLGKTMLYNPAYVALIVLWIFFSIISPRFFTARNVYNILTQVSITAIIAFGMTFVITSGEIDLSVGSVLCFTGMIFAGLSVLGFNVFFGFVLTVLIGMGMGALIGLTVTFFKIPSFIVTLAAMIIFRGAALLIKGGTTICEGIDASYFWFGQARIFGMPIPIIMLISIFIIEDFIFKKTTFGVNTRAVGSNVESARLAGIPVSRIKIMIFSMIGACSAIAGIITASRLGVGSPVTGYLKELDAITAVVLGGTTFTGGIGTIRGTFVGALVVAVLGNGLTLLGVSSYWQQVILGLVLISALALRKFQK